MFQTHYMYGIWNIINIFIIIQFNSYPANILRLIKTIIDSVYVCDTFNA